MATVVSLTEPKIRELLGNWEDLALTQDEVNEIINRLSLNQESLNNQITDLTENKLPELRERQDANNQVIADLNENVIPNIDNAIDQMQQDVGNLTNVTLPSIRADLESGIVNSLVRPQTLFSDEPPESTEDRELVDGDIWHDTNDGNRQHRWDGSQWVTFSVDVADFSITARKLISTRHLIY